MGRKKQSDENFDAIVALARELNALHKQMCDLQRPVVDDVCRRADSVSEHELGHCFDSILDCACIDAGFALFNKLCDTFRSRYPECVKDYIDIYKEIYGDDDETRKKPARQKPAPRKLKKAV